MRSLLSQIVVANLLILGLIQIGVCQDQPATQDAGIALPGQIDAKEIALQIELLSSPEFQIRERATQKLLEYGMSVLPILDATIESTEDAEINLRAMKVRQTIFDKEIDRRTDLLLHDADPKNTYGLEAWTEFSKIVGAGRLSKRLFVEMVRTHLTIAQSDFSNKDAFREEIERIAGQLTSSVMTGQATSLGDAVTLLYGSVRLEGECAADVESIITRLIRTYPFTLEIQKPMYASSLQKLIGKWLETTREDPRLLMIVAMEQSIPAGRVLAKKALSNPKIDREGFEIAMCTLIRLGTIEDLPLIEPFLNDERPMLPKFPMLVELPINPPPKPIDGGDEPSIPVGPAPRAVTRFFELRYQDLALAAAIATSGQYIKVYFPRALLHPLRGVQSQSLAFRDDDPDERKLAFQKWQEWRRANP